MAATIFGDGIYGAADETSSTVNLYVSSVSMDATSNVTWLPNHVGDETGVAIGNKGADLTFTGLLSVTDDLGKAVGDTLVAADIANSDIFANSSGVTVFYALSGNITRNAAGFQSGSLNCSGRDGLTDTTATTVS